MHLTWFRGYDAMAGRWLSRDPIGEVAGLNLYNYVIDDTINLVDPYGLDWRDWAQGAIDFTRGVGDTLSFGLSKWAREKLWGTAGCIENQGAYLGGQAAGVALSIAIGGGLGWARAGANMGRRGMEFSHWIPNRMGGPRSLWNGNYVTNTFHALTDPFRYRFMPAAWKAANQMPGPFWQQIGRLPWVYVGGAGGLGWGAGGATANNW